MKTISKKVAVKKVAKTAPKKVVANVIAIKSVSLPAKKVKKEKSVAKKITRVSAKKHLVVATNQNSFWLNDGQILNSLVALAESLKVMEAAVYKYHTNNGRHDFANWVDDVLADADCASALRTCKTVKTAYATVIKYLKEYSY